MAVGLALAALLPLAALPLLLLRCLLCPPMHEQAIKRIITPAMINPISGPLFLVDLFPSNDKTDDKHV